MQHYAYRRLRVSWGLEYGIDPRQGYKSLAYDPYDWALDTCEAPRCVQYDLVGQSGNLQIKDISSTTNRLKASSPTGLEASLMDPIACSAI